MGFLDQFTGKAIEQQVAEYSEVYGEVLLGLHRDVEHLQSAVARVHQTAERAGQQADRLRAEYGALRREYDAVSSDVRKALAQLDKLAQNMSSAQTAREQVQYAINRVNQLGERVDRAEAEVLSLRAAVAGLKAAQVRAPEGDTGTGHPATALLLRELEAQRRRVRLLAVLCTLSLLSSALLGVMTWTSGSGL